MFQSTRPRGARHAPGYDQRKSRYVSIHAPARGATGRRYPAILGGSCFNPRAREGRDKGKTRTLRPRFVSIHAPARGATMSGDQRLADQDVSIHAPARGATCTNWQASTVLYVSIHAPARGATKGKTRTLRPRFVSIHAPARGATKAGNATLFRRRRFNPRAREGRDCRFVTLRHESIFPAHSAIGDSRRIIYPLYQRHLADNIEKTSIANHPSFAGRGQFAEHFS